MTLPGDQTPSSSPSPDPHSPGRPGFLRRSLGHLAWLLAGAFVATLVVADPWNLHDLDTWLLGERVSVTAGEEQAAARKQLYTCSMHPHVIQDHPGPCPLCGMDLVPMRMDTDGGVAAQGERKIAFYRNPMTPTITSPVPAKDEMGMDYVPVYEDEVEGAVRGGATVTIDGAIVQNMNVQTEPVRRGDLEREIRTVGYLEYDQQKMVTVTTKYAGWIEKVYVNYVGEPVRKGAPLFEIYSPDLVQTETELLSALDFARRMEAAGGDAHERALALVEAARTRLGYWDVASEQVRQLETSGKVFRTLTVSAPAGGVVMMRMAGLEGMAAKPGMALFHIADLSSLWLSVEAFEDQLAWLKVGSRAEISLSYFPGETFKGRVRFIEPQVTEKTRTVPLRLEVPNAAGRLRAGMYATVRFQPVVARDAVLVPSLAILRTGERNVVVVASGGGRFTPREVVLGAEGDGVVQVLQGLEAGEEIVTSAQFLLDSESNLREAIQKLIATRAEGKG